MSLGRVPTFSTSTGVLPSARGTPQAAADPPLNV